MIHPDRAPFAVVDVPRRRGGHFCGETLGASRPEAPRVGVELERSAVFDAEPASRGATGSRRAPGATTRGSRATRPVRRATRARSSAGQANQPTACAGSPQINEGRIPATRMIGRWSFVIVDLDVRAGAARDREDVKEAESRGTCGKESETAAEWGHAFAPR